MKIAFWNINNKNLSDLLVEFVNEKQIDILLLAETGSQTNLDFLTKQNIINLTRQYAHIFEGKISLLSSLEPGFFFHNERLIVSPRWNAFLVEIPTLIKLNLVCVHFHSKVNWSDDSLSLECVNLSRDIEIVERTTGISETLVIGDFNMNPYESGLVAANGLHALPDLNYLYANPEGRKIDGIKYKYFYNPMWNFFGDKTMPLGTHYYRESGHVSKEWNIYDQVIYRPSLLKIIKKASVEIVYQIGNQNLINVMNRPDKDKYSDHLPIIIEINL